MDLRARGVVGVYQPFRDLKVVAGAGAAADLVPLEECPAVKLPDSSHAGELLRTRHLFVARWQRPDNTAPAFRVTRTLGRYLAAWINRYPTATGPVMLGELPDKTSYSPVELPGGIAVITEHGAFVLDAGRHDGVKSELLKEEFCRTLRILHRLETSEQGTHALLDEARAYFRGVRRGLSQEDLLRRLSLERIEIALEQHQARTAPVIPEARLFGEALRARWGISNWLDSLSNDVERIKDVLHSRSELLNSRHTAWFAGAALPLLFTIPLAAFTIAEYHNWKTVTGIIAGLILVNVLLFLGFLRLTAWLDRPPPGSPVR